MNNFQGKKVLVTGGGGGLGLEIAQKFLSAGSCVTVLDKDATLLNEVKTAHPNMTCVQVDLLDWTATRKVMDTIGHVDHLVNNAGVNRRQMFVDVTEENLDFIFGVNFKAVVNISQVVAKGMIANGTSGTIVNISSLYGKVALENISMYACSKAAVVMLTKAMSLELGSHGIRVNAVCPTYMVTPLTKTYIEKNPDLFKGVLDRQVIKRFAEPGETADSVLFLSSSASSMITGQAIDVDGGYLAS